LTNRIDLNRLVSHVFPLIDLDKALKTASNPKEKPVKIVIKP
jgi:threonine dehydrogenase-like Zn-dependent dehydrogenase